MSVPSAKSYPSFSTSYTSSSWKELYTHKYSQDADCNDHQRSLCSRSILNSSRRSRVLSCSFLDLNWETKRQRLRYEDLASNRERPQSVELQKLFGTFGPRAAFVAFTCFYSLLHAFTSWLYMALYGFDMLWHALTIWICVYGIGSDRQFCVRPSRCS